MKRVLLDEGVPKDLAEQLLKEGIDATAFPNDWKQLSNGALLTEAERQGYEVLITNDKSMSYQQSLKNRKLAVLILPTNRRDDVLALVPQIVASLSEIKPKQFLALLGDWPKPPSRNPK